MAAAVLPAAGCGSSDKGKLGPGQAKGLSKYVELAQNAVDAKKCADAAKAAADGQHQAAGMQGVDPDLQDNLVSGFRHLSQRITSDCDKPDKTPTPTPTDTETAAPTDTATPKPTDTATATPTVTATPTAAPTDAPTSFPTPDTGGADATP